MHLQILQQVDLDTFPKQLVKKFDWFVWRKLMSVSLASLGQ